MNADDLELAKRFRAALETAYAQDEREPLYPLLAEDVEWVTPKRTLRGIEEVRGHWSTAPDKLDVEFEDGDWEDLGDGRLALSLRHVYRMKGTGDFAYERRRRIELTVRNGRVSRYEMQILG